MRGLEKYIKSFVSTNISGNNYNTLIKLLYKFECQNLKSTKNPTGLSLNKFPQQRN